MVLLIDFGKLAVTELIKNLSSLDGEIFNGIYFSSSPIGVIKTEIQCVFYSLKFYEPTYYSLNLFLLDIG